MPISEAEFTIYQQHVESELARHEKRCSDCQEDRRELAGNQKVLMARAKWVAAVVGFITSIVGATIAGIIVWHLTKGP